MGRVAKPRSSCKPMHSQFEGTGVSIAEFGTKNGVARKNLS